MHWRIQVGAPPAHAPPRVQILSFWHTNFSKGNCLGSWRPPPRGRRPLREILDPPLLWLWSLITGGLETGNFEVKGFVVLNLDYKLQKFVKYRFYRNSVEEVCFVDVTTYFLDLSCILKSIWKIMSDRIWGLNYKLPSSYGAVPWDIVPSFLLSFSWEYP